MNEFCSSAELNSSDPVYPTVSNTTEVFNKDLEVVGVGLYPIVLNAPYKGRITSFNIQAGSGTGVFTVKIGAINVTGLVGKPVSSTEADFEPTDLNVFDVDQDIYIEVTTADTLLNVSITVEVLRETGTATVLPTEAPTDGGTSISAAFLERISIALPIGFSIVDIPFGTTKLDIDNNPTNNYSVSWELPENFTDTIVERIYPTTVVGRLSTKVTVLLNAAPTTANTIVRTTITTNGAATSIISGGGTTFIGSDVSVATTNLPLRGDNAGNAIAVTQQTGDAATGLATLNLFSSTPTYDAAKLTGNVSVNRLNGGAAASSATFWCGNETWATPPGGSGGSVVADTIWDVRGDLAVATGPNIAVRFPLGAATRVLQSSNVTATGLDWALVSASNFNLSYINGIPSTPSLRTLGTTSNEAAAGDDSRITGALQASQNLSTLASPAFARLNLGLGSIAVQTAPTGTVASSNNVITFTNKSIDAATNTITGLTGANFTGSTTLNLTDPNADRILFWDDSAGVFDWLPPVTGWTAMTGTGSKAALAAAAAGTASVGYVQAELQGALNRIAALEARLKAYDDVFFTDKLISA